MKSFNSTMDDYRKLLVEARQNHLVLTDLNFDTGKPTAAGDYKLADKAYARFVDKLDEKHFQGLQPDLRTNILSYYEHAKAPVATQAKDQDWQKLQRELQELRDQQPTPAT